MFSPNRLLTPKEQALLVGVAFAVLVGSGAIFWASHRRAMAAETVVAAGKAEPAPAKPAPAKPAPPHTAEKPAQPSASAPAPTAQAPAPANTTATATPTAPPAAAPAVEIAVAVRGGVQRPGLYRLPSDSRVADLVMKAGGATAEADLSEINLAARLLDGTTLTVPVGARVTREEGRISGHGSAHRAEANPAEYLAGMAMPEASGPTPGRSATRQEPAADTAPEPGQSKSRSTASGNGLINLNTATQAELESLPGIGAVLAQHIIDQRPFQSVEELDNVPGIGKKRLEAVRNLVTAE